ncbi:unnamed protein product [Gordionus sp. m RMFG-2023]
MSCQNYVIHVICQNLECHLALTLTIRLIHNYYIINQNRLTNVAYVRMKKGGKHFEIACYKNKVQSWRNKIEKDIDEVLQTPVVFANLSRGQIAKKEDLISAFGTDNMMEACLKALDVIKKLKETISIERVQMKIKLQCSAKFSKKIIEKMSIIENSTTENKTRLDNGDLELVLLIDPGTLRSIDEIVRNETKGQGIVEIISVNELKDENN